MLLGNDLVDLLDALPQRKEVDARFLERVFTASERQAILRSENGALLLWKLWAAKESLFKVAVKLEPGIVFSHRRFRLSPTVLAELAERNQTYGTFLAHAFHGHYRISLHWDWNEHFIHCMASWNTGVKNWNARVELVGSLAQLPFTDREAASVHSAASRDARQLAKTMLRDELPETEIVRIPSTSGLLPPAIYSAGRPLSGLDVSLSHDGRFVAAMTSCP